jgi:phosphoglycolate phosphatase
MIGDSRTDIATAQAAGIPVVGVTFGYTDVPVRDLQPDMVIDDFDELPGLVARWMGASRESRPAVASAV